MRVAIALSVLLASVSLASGGSAQSKNFFGGSSRGTGGPPPKCQLDPPRDCGLVAVSVGFGVLSSVYLGLYAWNPERPGAIHAGGAIAGGLSVAVGAGFAIDSKLKVTHQRFAAGFAILTGVPALLLGLYSLVTGDEARDEEKPGNFPSWYGSPSARISFPLPTSYVDARGAPFPGLAMSGAFL